MKHLPRTAALFSALLAVAACGSTPATPENPLDDLTLPAGMEIPDMQISVYQRADVLGGEEVHLSAVLAQGKPVVLNFWAAECGPCRLEMPELQRVYAARHHEVTIVGIDVGPQWLLGTREQGRELLRELDVHYPAGTTFNQNVQRDYLLLAMPATLFIHPDGSLMRPPWMGWLDESKLNELIDQLVEE